MTEDQRQAIVRGWHANDTYIGRLWESLNNAQEARGRAVRIVDKTRPEETS